MTPDIVAARQNAHNAQKQAIKAEPGSGSEQNGVDVCFVVFGYCLYYMKKNKKYYRILNTLISIIILFTRAQHAMLHQLVEEQQHLVHQKTWM